MSEHAGPPNRILVLGIAIVVVGFAALLTGCAGTRTPPAMRGGKPTVTVHIWVDASNNLHANPQTAVVSLGAKEYIEWDCDNGKLACTMDFDPSNYPFSGTHFVGHGAQSGAPSVGPDMNKRYKYKVIVQGYTALDPDVIVEN